MLVDTTKAKYAILAPLDGSDITWTDGFWKDTTNACMNAMVPQLLRMFEDAGISHVVENFRICAGKAEGNFDGTVFGDGDFYKWMEAELYSAIHEKDEKRIAKLDEYIELIEACQQDDGYLSTKQIIEQRQGIGGRLKDINEFEVYNMGHLFTSACQYYRMTGKDRFLHVAERAAGYLEKMYHDAEKNGEVQTAVCPSHYMGLIELYRVTGKEQYLALAKKAIELRDQVKNGMDDNQDRIPLKEHEKMIGHAVRATYLYAGVADLYAEIGDEDYLNMMHKVWNNMINTKIYLTGGIGALYNGTSPYGNFFTDQKIHQAFGYEYQLPNVTAYNETCASIGLVMWAYRMFLIEPKAEYFDMIERVFLNTNLAAVSLDQKRYFYENMLRRARKMEYELIWPLTRSEYILSYCCPPNLARNICQSCEYAYALDENRIWTGLYGASSANVRLKNGDSYTIHQETSYPYSGEIRFRFTDAAAEKIIMMLRIPAWTKTGRITVGNKTIALSAADAGSYIEVIAADPSTQVILNLDMPVRYTISHSMVEENSWMAACERGPIVYCVEGMDVEGDTLDDYKFDPEADCRFEMREIEGRQIGFLVTEAFRAQRAEYDRNALYQTLPRTTWKKETISLIPYFAWDNRGFSEMRIWFPYL